jgi:hypothetical protein
LNLAEEKEWQSAKHGKLTGLKFVFSLKKNRERKPRLPYVWFVTKNKFILSSIKNQ